VLVLKGEACNNLGQMAIVSRRAGSQVEIGYQGSSGDHWVGQRKRPSSLVRMEEGVEMAVNGAGEPVIRRMQSDENSDDRDGIGCVSDDEEELVQ
jgi:hypothetical protein